LESAAGLRLDRVGLPAELLPPQASLVLLVRRGLLRRREPFPRLANLRRSREQFPMASVAVRAGLDLRGARLDRAVAIWAFREDHCPLERCGAPLVPTKRSISRLAAELEPRRRHRRRIIGDLDTDPVFAVPARDRPVSADPQHDPRRALRAAGLLPQTAQGGKLRARAGLARCSTPQGAVRPRAAATLTLNAALRDDVLDDGAYLDLFFVGLNRRELHAGLFERGFAK
jgi:hypothetical protein